MKYIGIFVLVLAVFLSGCGCGKHSEGKSVKAASQAADGTTSLGDSDAVASGSFQDYFPTQTDTEWKYTIKLISGDPLFFQRMVWPQGETSMGTEVRGRFLEDHTKTYCLQYRVKGPAPSQGPLKFPLSVEIEVIKDDLGVFRDAKKVFWAIRESDKYVVYQVLVLDANSSGSPYSGSMYGGGFGEDGYSMKIFFFEEEAGVGIGIGSGEDKESKDMVYFEGNVDDESMHFQRRVKAHVSETPAYGTQDPEGDKILNSAFKEDYIFRRDVGLISMTQTVGDRTTMEITLDKFTRGD